jgi:hypothetical protein
MSKVEGQKTLQTFKPSNFQIFKPFKLSNLQTFKLSNYASGGCGMVIVGQWV